MHLLFGTLFFVLGTIIGSFLNVIILRFNTKSTILGRSLCFSCGKKLNWYELIPIVSFFFLSARCLGCKSKISYQYPLVELGTGFLFLGVYLKWVTDFSLIIPLIVVSLLTIIFVYDIHHKIIPNSIVYTFILISFIQMFLKFEPFSFYIPNTLDLLAGPILFFPFFALWFFSKGRWIGLGDAKLALGIGWMLGLMNGFSAIVFAFWIGAIVSVMLVLFSKINTLNWGLNMKSEIPFAPFLIIGFLFVFFSDINITLLPF